HPDLPLPQRQGIRLDAEQLAEGVVEGGEHAAEVVEPRLARVRLDPQEVRLATPGRLVAGVARLERVEARERLARVAVRGRALERLLERLALLGVEVLLAAPLRQAHERARVPLGESLVALA